MKNKLILGLIALWMIASSFYRFYPSEVISVYDGDTITVDVYLGFGISKRERLRLYNLDAPEVRGSERYEGLKSRDALRKKILHKNIRIETLKNDKKGKYGRVIATIWLGDENINTWMIDNGYAEYKVY
jgi:micrococcal nuclease